MGRKKTSEKVEDAILDEGDDIKTLDDAINEATIDMKNNKEEQNDEEK